MTKLSPAAKAVAKAALDASSFCKEETCPYRCEEIAAAVLRAVAEQGATFYWDSCADPDGDYLDDNALSTIRRALEQLPDEQ